MRVRIVKTTTKTEIFIAESESCEKAVEELNQGKNMGVGKEATVVVEIGAYEAHGLVDI